MHVYTMGGRARKTHITHTHTYTHNVHVHTHIQNTHNIYIYTHKSMDMHRIYRTNTDMHKYT